MLGRQKPNVLHIHKLTKTVFKVGGVSGGENKATLQGVPRERRQLC